MSRCNRSGSESANTFDAEAEQLCGVLNLLNCLIFEGDSVPLDEFLDRGDQQVVELCGRSVSHILYFRRHVYFSRNKV